MVDSVVLDAPDPRELDDGDLIDAIESWERLASRVAAAQLAAIAELARRRPRDLLDRPGGPADRGDPRRPEVSEFAVDELAAALRLSRPAAGARLHVAVELARLPGTASALREGRIDAVRARAVADAVTGLDDPTVRAVEERVLVRAGRQTAGQLRASLSRAILSVDPPAGERRLELALSCRRVTVTPQLDGTAELWAVLSAEGAAAIYGTLDAVARAAPAGDPRRADERRADALVDLVLAGATTTPATGPLAGRPSGTPMGGGPAATGGGRPSDLRTHVYVTVPASTVLGLSEEPGELAGHGPVPASVARRLARAGRWQKVAVDTASGVVTQVGLAGYTPSAALADLVRMRDRTCRFPGCRQPARRCDLDHVVPYPEGPTAAGNLATLCRHHHRLKHGTTWRVEADEGTLVWTSPTGHRYATGPPDSRGETGTSPLPERPSAGRRRGSRGWLRQ